MRMLMRICWTVQEDVAVLLSADTHLSSALIMPFPNCTNTNKGWMAQLVSAYASHRLLISGRIRSRVRASLRSSLFGSLFAFAVTGSAPLSPALCPSLSSLYRRVLSFGSLLGLSSSCRVPARRQQGRWAMMRADGMSRAARRRVSENGAAFSSCSPHLLLSLLPLSVVLTLPWHLSRWLHAAAVPVSRQC